MPIIQKTTLRPGLLVGLKTSIVGNVQYVSETLDPEHTTADGGREAEWKTKKMVADAAEHDEAVKVRSDCRSMIIKVCANSAFGPICPEDKAEQLDVAVAAARAMAEQFNAKAKLTRIRINVLCGRISPSDEAALRAINGEVRDLISAMEDGVRNFDVDAIREAAKQAKSVGQILSSDAQARIQVAIDAARATANQLSKAGDTAAKALDKAAIARLSEARTAFLDIDSEPATVGAPIIQGRAVDFEPVEEVMVDDSEQYAAANFVQYDL